MNKILLCITIFLFVFISCQQKQETTKSVSAVIQNDFDGYIPPVKLDSLLYENHFLLNRDQDEFSFQKPIAFAKIYEDVIDENGKGLYSDYPEQIISEIRFNKLGKLSSIIDTSNKNNLTIIYNNQNLVSYVIDHKIDDITNEDVDYVTEYKYDKNGNLISKFIFNKTKNDFKFWNYSEYKYYREKENIIVEEIELEQFALFYFNKNKYRFDTKKRLIFKERYSENVLARGKVITSEEKYIYENADFPEKITKVEMVATTDNSRQTETYLYNKQGKFTEFSQTTNPKVYITTKKYNYLAKNKVEEINEHRTIKSYQVMDITMDPNYQKTHNIRTFDDFGNILIDEKITEEPQNSYSKNTYKFDNNKNWIEKIVKMHSYIPQEYQNEDVKEDEYLKYRREINYTQFEENQSLPFEIQSADNFRKKILEQQKFYEKFK